MNKKLILKIALIVLLIIIISFGIYLGISGHTWKVLAKDML